AKRQVDEVGCLVVSPGTDIAEGRDARGDQRGKELIDRSFKGDGGDRLPSGAVEMHISPAEQTPEMLAIRVAVEIEQDRLLAAIIGPEMQGLFRIRLVTVEGTDPARRA